MTKYQPCRPSWVFGQVKIENIPPFADFYLSVFTTLVFISLCTALSFMF